MLLLSARKIIDRLDGVSHAFDAFLYACEMQDIHKIIHASSIGNLQNSP